jgi:hypothetical protein
MAGFVKDYLILAALIVGIAVHQISPVSTDKIKNQIHPIFPPPNRTIGSTMKQVPTEPGRHPLASAGSWRVIARNGIKMAPAVSAATIAMIAAAGPGAM